MDNLLGIEELTELIEEICDKVKLDLTTANRMGNLKEVLKKYNYDMQEHLYYEPNIAKVLVIGDSAVDINDLKRVIRKFKLPEDRFEFVLGYKEAKSYPMNSLMYNPRYCDIFVGPMPHKTKGMGDCGSIIAKIKNNPHEYPKLTELKDGNGLKITKKSFENALINSELLKCMS